MTQRCLPAAVAGDRTANTGQDRTIVPVSCGLDLLTGEHRLMGARVLFIVSIFIATFKTGLVSALRIQYIDFPIIPNKSP